MQGFMITLLTCSITMSVLALLYMVASPFLAKRYSEKGRYYAWLIIVIGLIIPFRPQFGASIVTVTPTETTAPIIQMGNGAPIITPMEETTLPSALSSISLWHIAAVVWLAGVVIFLAHHMVRHYRFMKMARRWCESVSDEQTLTIMHNLKKKLGIAAHIDLFQCESVGSPMMVGFLKPRILLPKQTFSPDDLGFILNHELVHYKRNDLWYRALVLLATAIHWFNPIVYLVAKAIDALCEMSCDVEVVRNSDIDTRQHYSEAIIGVVKYQSKMKTALSTNFYGGKKGMKKRIFSIMDTGKKRTGALLICLAALLTIGTGAAFAITGSPENDYEAAVYDEALTLEDELVASLAYMEQLGLTEFGVTIDKEAQEVYYNGERVAAYADNQTTYSFKGVWIGLANEGVFIRPVKDRSGNITDVEIIPEEEIESGKAGFGRANGDEVYDAAEVYEVDATDNIAPDDEANPTSESPYSAAVVDANGYEVNLGEFNSKEAAQQAANEYFSEQINLGTMTQQEADELLKSMSQQWDEWIETVTVPAG